MPLGTELKTKLFGSSANRFGMKKGDIDIMVLIKTDYPEIEILRKIAVGLKGNVLVIDIDNLTSFRLKNEECCCD